MATPASKDVTTSATGISTQTIDASFEESTQTSAVSNSFTTAQDDPVPETSSVANNQQQLSSQQRLELAAAQQQQHEQINDGEKSDHAFNEKPQHEKAQNVDEQKKMVVAQRASGLLSDTITILFGTRNIISR